MRILATFLCTFLFLLFIGSCSYVYIVWKHFMNRVEKVSNYHGYHRRHHNVKVARIKYDEESDMFVTMVSTQSDSSPTMTTQGSLFNALPTDKLMTRLNHYESQIVSQLRNAVVETGRGVKLGEVKNYYHVKYEGSMASSLKEQMDNRELICDAMERINLETFVKGNQFFKNQQLDQYFSEFKLWNGKTFNSCGVVSSSGSLQGSNLGTHIDSNDCVIRFNNAPTKGHVKDVGSKTSLRIVNSQVVGKPEFGFLESKSQMYSQSPILVWDPSAYNASLSEWYANPDYPFFETFFSKRLMRPDDDLYLLHPKVLWSIWDWIQMHTKYPLLPNPPSSGFLGIILALKHCHRIHVYEYVPSMRLTKRCHYYDEEENFGCTIGDWHPLAAEKLMALAMNSASKVKVYSDGYLTLNGAPQVKCDGGNDETN